MAQFVLRVWLPDRPGALGAVASRIGAVRGDLIGIEILERGGGRAIDELVVDLPDANLVPLLLREVREVDGVDVEDVRAIGDAAHDVRSDALDTAVVLIEATGVDDLFARLVQQASNLFEADWVAIVDERNPAIVAKVGTPPELAWLAAFLAGSQESARVVPTESGPDDVMWSVLESAVCTVVLGREGRPLRARERHHVTALARIADARWRDLAQFR